MRHVQSPVSNMEQRLIWTATALQLLSYSIVCWWRITKIDQKQSETSQSLIRAAHVGKWLWSHVVYLVTTHQPASWEITHTAGQELDTVGPPRTIHGGPLSCCGLVSDRQDAGQWSKQTALSVCINNKSAHDLQSKHKIKPNMVVRKLSSVRHAVVLAPLLLLLLNIRACST